MKKGDKIYDLIVIGGGPSGMMMAGRAAELGARVLLIERNRKLGEKLKMTGGGRCNITNAEFDVRAFLENFKESKDFLYSPFSQFSSRDTFKFFEKLGLPLVVEARKRAFPKTQNASDVFRVLTKYMRGGGVNVVTDTRVTTFKRDDKKIISVKTASGGEYAAYNFAIATGGVAAPKTGSTGDGLNMLKKVGHTIQKPNPNLVPLKVKEKWIKDLAGVSLSFMSIKFIQNGKTKIKKTGKILFTHFGISGPLILNIAHEVKKLLKSGEVTASIDMFPDTNLGEMDRKLWRLFEKNKNKKIKNVLPDMMPESLALKILTAPDLLLSEKDVHSITKDERKKLTHRIKNLTFSIPGTMGFDRSIVADGGAILEEVDFKTMQSKIHSNLYLLGDILNINRPSGGFSLQLCWTTGWVAGSDVGKKIK